MPSFLSPAHRVLRFSVRTASILLAVAHLTAAAGADSVDDLVRAALEKQRTPGASLLVMQGGKLVKAAGYGLTDLEHQVPVKPETLFQSGSIGKQFTALLVVLLGPAQARALTPFQDPSPDHQFEVVCDVQAQPPFKIVNQASGETVATLDNEHVSSRGMDSSWSPDGKRLVVLVNWRRWTEVVIFRQVDGRFEQAEGPEVDDESAVLDRWISPNKVRLKADDRARTLVITDHGAKLVR